MADDLFDTDEWADLDAMLAGLDEDQRAFVEAVRARKGNVQSPAGAGCHAAGAEVLRADGLTARIEDVRIGDLLMGPDGCAKRVVALGRGRAAMYRVVPTKGEPLIVTGAHILPLVWRKKGRAKTRRCLIDVDSARAQIKPAWGYKLERVGVEDFGRAPVDFVVDPYFLGVLLGDGGGFAPRESPNVSKPDAEIYAAVCAEAARLGMRVSTHGTPTNPTHCLIRSKQHGSSKLKCTLAAMGLENVRSETRFVPIAYKCAARATRLQVLAGLLDTDGHVTRGGFDFISKSAQLAADVAFLARSCGMAAYLRECRKGCQGGFVGTYHRVSISGECAVIPTRIPRKQAPPRKQIKDVRYVGIEAIEYAGVHAYFGVTVEPTRAGSPDDHLYLMADFTVTHNSGKTRSVVAAIAALVHDGVRENDIIATTFTARAGEELRQRLAQVLGARRAAQVRVGTFHSLAGRAIKAAQIPVLCDSSRNLDGDGERRAPGVPHANLLWSRILGYRAIAELRNKPGLDVDLKALDLSVGDYALAVGLIRSRNIDYADLRAAKEAAKDVKLPQFWKAWSYYEEAKLSLEAFDFADVLAAYRDGLAAGTIKDSAEIVVVDECQDDDEVQTDVAARLAGGNPLVVVGDEKQAIFSWRGASPKFFMDFARRFDAKVCALRHNYRSVPAIVEMGNRIARGKSWSLGTDAIAVRPAPLFPTIRKLPGARNPIEEGEQVAKRIRSALDEGAKPDDFAVLARTNAILGAYETGFIRHRVPCVVIGGQGFFTKKEAQAVLAYAALIGHDSPTQLEKVLDTPKRFLGAKFMEEVRAEWKPGANLVEVIRRVAPRVRGKADALANDIERLRVAGWPSAEDMRREDEPDALALDGPASRDDEARLRGLALIAQILLGKKDEPDDDSAEARDPEKDTAAMTWAAIRIAATFPSPKALYEFAKLCMANVAGVDGERARNKQTTRGKVVLSTVFKAKGLEYKHVIVSASEGNFPHARAIKAWKKGDRERIEEEERLFYVATTRAQDRLEFAWAKMDLYHRDAGPSAFLDYIEGTCETYVGDYVDEDDDDYAGARAHDDWRDDDLDASPAPTPPRPASTPAPPPGNVLPFPARPPAPEPREWTGTEWKAARAAEMERLTTVPVQVLGKSDRAALEALLLPLGFVWHSGAFRGRSRGVVDLDVHPWPHARVTATFDTPRGPRPVVPEPPILRYTARWRVDLLDLLDTVNDQVWQAPTCPECRSPCHVRGNDKGKFWGCMRFPDCRGISREKAP